MNRKTFISQIGLAGTAVLLLENCGINSEPRVSSAELVQLKLPKATDDVFSYIKRLKGKFDLRFYRQILGAANEFKEGDASQGIAAADQTTREYARQLLSNTPIKELIRQPVFTDELSELIEKTTEATIRSEIQHWTLGRLKSFLLTAEEQEIKHLMPGLSSDTIALLVRTMTNEELIQASLKIFNPLPGSQIGAKGYLSARVQPNSPTDHPEDIIWQVFNAWSYAVGDLVLGTNPVSSEVESVAAIESALYDLIETFGLEHILPNCVLSHIDVQAQAEEVKPGQTGIWFQSLAGTVAANKTFDLSIEKMQKHASKRKGRYGLYAETGQGADYTNGHGEGFDMVIHESRKYGFLRALKNDMNPESWVHVNDVAGFIGPEVFKTREQLVRCCLEDTLMGKLHGLTIGLDICSTLHMDVSLDDLEWCINQIMPANPAYLMALPTRNDPMLSYLTTAFHDHLRIREKFGYRVNDAMWDFFKKIEIIDDDGKPTKNFGDPVWVYYQYLKMKGDSRSWEEIKKEGIETIDRIDKRGVFISKGYGENYWLPEPKLEARVRNLYKDAKISLWTEMPESFFASLQPLLILETQSTSRKDYIYHPESGEKLSRISVTKLSELKNLKEDILLVISDGLNSKAITDEGHLAPFLNELKKQLNTTVLKLQPQPICIKYGRVRAGYAAGEILFGNPSSSRKRSIIHLIGERPGTGHHNYSAYITVAPENDWYIKGKVDHDITRVVSGISDSALSPAMAARATTRILNGLFDLKTEKPI